jgi:hypothetical protein
MNTRLSERELVSETDPEMEPTLRWVFKNNVHSGEKIAKLREIYQKQGYELVMFEQGKQVIVSRVPIEDDDEEGEDDQ